MSNAKTSDDLIFQLEGKPKFTTAYPLGLQHVLTMFAGNLAPILMMQNVVVGDKSLSPASIILMIQCAMLASGLTTLVQLYPIKLGKSVRIGAGLPIVMGTSFAFVVTAQTVLKGGMESGLSAEQAMGLVLTASIIGAISEVVLGFTYKYLKKVFTPIVIGSVLLTIGMHLLDVGRDYIAGGAGSKFIPADAPNYANFHYGSPKNLFLGFLVFFIVLLFNRFGKGLWKSAAILIAMVIGYLVAIPLGMVDFSKVGTYGLLAIPVPFKFGLNFQVGAAVSFIILYIVSGMETIGNTSGITVAAFDRKATEEETAGALLADAGGSMLAGMLNSLPNTAFGQNAGLVSMTKIVNKWCIAMGAFTLIVASFIPNLGAIFASIPNAVLGGGVITVFAMILMNGMKLIAKAGFTERNILILGVTFGIGYGLGGHLDAVAGLPSFLTWIFKDATASVCIVAILANLAFADHSVEETI